MSRPWARRDRAVEDIDREDAVEAEVAALERENAELERRLARMRRVERILARVSHVLAVLAVLVLLGLVAAEAFGWLGLFSRPNFDIQLPTLGGQ